jgi:hypothetical protein
VAYPKKSSGQETPFDHRKEKDSRPHRDFMAGRSQDQAVNSTPIQSANPQRYLKYVENGVYQQISTEPGRIAPVLLPTKFAASLIVD